MKNKVLLVSLFLFFTSPFPGWSAIVMKSDGVIFGCTVDGEQTVIVKTSSEERRIKFKNIIWMAGEDVKRMRISGEKGTVSGEVGKTIDIKCASGEILKFPKDIIFFHKEDFDFKNLGGIKIEEYDGTSSTETLPKTERNGSFKVTLMPENWEGDIEISNPIYPKEVSSKENVAIDLWVKADGNVYSNLSSKAAMLRFGFRFEGYIYRQIEHVGTIKGNAINTNYIEFPIQGDSFVNKDEPLMRIKLTLKEPMKDYSSVNQAYLFVSSYLQTEELGRGNLKIDRTCSNVLKLDLKTKFEFRFDLKKR
jgi:hypothetical protein